jgi:hypothetical protein
VQRLKYEETRFDDWANLLLEQATLAEGGSLDDPAGFVKRINDLMLALSLGSGRQVITGGGPPAAARSAADSRCRRQDADSRQLSFAGFAGRRSNTTRIARTSSGACSARLLDEPLPELDYA